MHVEAKPSPRTRTPLAFLKQTTLAARHPPIDPLSPAACVCEVPPRTRH